MNVKRFIARSSREALNQVRMAFGADAVVLSNKPCDAGVEVLAMAPEGIAQIEQAAETAPRQIVSAPAPAAAAANKQPAVAAQAPVEQDVQRLAMSTLSFQDYVRERLLRRRRAAMQPEAPETVMPTFEKRAPVMAAAMPTTTPVTPQPMPQPMRQAAQPEMQPMPQPMAAAPAMPISVPAVREPLRLPESVPSLADPTAAQREQTAVM